MRVLGSLNPSAGGDTVAPTVPQSVVATAQGAGSVQVVWSASFDAVGVTGYQVWRNGSPLNTTASTSYTDGTTQPSTLYSYTVSAFDAAGNSSAQSSQSQVTTPANATPSWQAIPAQTLIVGNSYTLNLALYASDADQDTLTYSIPSGTLPTGLTRTGALISGTPTTAGQTPTITVRVADAFAQADTTIAFSTFTADVTAPPVPTGLAASAVSSSQINLSWSASVDASGGANQYVSGTQDYRLYRSTDQTNFSLRTTVTSPSYSDTGLAASTRYDYKIAARDVSLNESAQSTAVNATTQASSGLVHGAAATASGSGFGARSVSVDFFDDDSFATTAAAGYANLYPDASGASYNMAYRTPAAAGRSVALPHNNITKYLCGAHYNSTGASNGSNSGYDVKVDMPGFTKTNGRVWYLSWYERADPLFTTDLQVPDNDNNYKYFYINGPNGFAEEPGIYMAFRSDSGEKNPQEDASSSWNNQGFVSYWNSPDNNGNNLFWNYSSNSDPSNGWVFRELWFKEATDSTGYMYEVVNNRTATQFKFPSGSGNKLSSILRNKLTLAYEGPTDQGTGTARSFSIGGYCRNYGNTGNYPQASNNFRFWVNIYIQGGSFARVMLGNNATYASATILAAQKVNSWAATAVGYTVNKGALSAGTVWEYVFDVNNVLVQTTSKTMN